MSPLRTPPPPLSRKSLACKRLLLFYLFLPLSFFPSFFSFFFPPSSLLLSFPLSFELSLSLLLFSSSRRNVSNYLPLRPEQPNGRVPSALEYAGRRGQDEIDQVA